MSAYPSFGTDWRKRWVQIGRSSVLHRVATTEGDYETEDRVGTQGTTSAAIRGCGGCAVRGVAAGCAASETTI